MSVKAYAVSIKKKTCPDSENSQQSVKHHPYEYRKYSIVVAQAIVSHGVINIQYMFDIS